MKLIDVLKALVVNTNLSVTLVDSDETTLITFNSQGYSSIESDLGDKEVKKIKITSNSAVTLILGDLLGTSDPDEP